METGYWRDVIRTGLRLPQDRTLSELTAELTVMLGSPDPEIRDGIAWAALSTWLEQGVYDELIPGLGDGMAAGLVTGLTRSGKSAVPGDHSVLRRAMSARALGACLRVGGARGLVSGTTVLRWGDLLAGWFLREPDSRAHLPGAGEARALARGAEALAELAASPFLQAPELTVVLDIVADRALDPGTTPLISGELDAMAGAVRAALLRGLIPTSVTIPWLARIAAGAHPGAHLTRETQLSDPWVACHNSQALLRALHLQLELSQPPVPDRADLILAVVEAIQVTNMGSFTRILH